MTWDCLNRVVDKNVSELRLAKLIVIQLGSNDLGIKKRYELYSDIKLGLLRLKVMCPNARIVWSEILMRRYWHSAQDGRALEKSRKRLNLLLRNFMQTIGGCVIRHSNIRASEKSLYRFDGTHLSNTGNEVYLNNIQGAIELFLSNDGPLVFPPLLIIDFAKKGSYGKL
jgi:lysophospholipase L1-like esterase